MVTYGYPDVCFLCLYSETIILEPNETVPNRPPVFKQDMLFARTACHFPSKCLKSFISAFPNA